MLQHLLQIRHQGLQRIFCLLLCVCILTASAEAQKSKEQKTKVEKKTTQKTDDDFPPPPDIEQLEATKIDVVAVNVDTAAPPNDELTKEIMKFLNTTNALNLGAQFADLIVKRDLVDPQHLLPDEFFIRMSKAMTEGEGRRLFSNLVANIYRDHFSLQDMKDLNAFYSTPTGKKVVATLPLILVESTKRGEQLGGIMAKQIFEQLVKEGLIKEQ